MGLSGDRETKGSSPRQGSLPGLPVGPGFVPNAVTMLAVQGITVLVALLLDGFGFPEEAIIIIFVLGVLLTAIATEGRAYSMAASLVALLTFNYFIVEPRYSLRAWGPSYPETFVVMFAVALIASHLVAQQREGARALMRASLVAQHEQLRADLLRSVSHDLRTPLTAISGKADLLATEGELLDAETRRKTASDIHDEAEWLTEVVENILSMTRLEDGAVTLNMQPEAVEDVVAAALEHVLRDTGHHVVRVEAPDELVIAQMDARVVSRVIMNLVNNALAYTPAGCHITISWERDGQWARITVADDGPGIPENERERVFEPFYTSAAGSSDGHRGIGLGLPLSKAIVEAHGGTIDVLSVEPHGAAFTFTLPIEEVPRDE